MKSKNVLIGILILAVLAVISYSLFVTLRSEKVIVTCPNPDIPSSCIITAHFHAYIPIKIFGEDYRLPIEKGRLDRPHTHEEKNIIHWHDKLPYNPQTEEILDTEPLTLGAFFDEIGVPFDEDRIGEEIEGHDGGTLKMFVNGVPSTAFRDYIWRDHDVIELFFDARTTEEVEQEVRDHLITFPTLGRG